MPPSHTETGIAPAPPRNDAPYSIEQSQQLSADGRVARRQRNRERVVDAYVELLEEGVSTPTAGELAERAEVTARTVYRYLHEDDHLRSDIAERVVSKLLAPSVPNGIETASQHDRIESFVAFRLDAYERIPVIMNVVHRHRAYDPVVTSAIGTFRGIIRSELDRCFAPELDRLEPADRKATVVSLQVVLLIDSLQHMYREMNHSRNDVHVVLCRHFGRVLAEPSGDVARRASFADRREMISPVS